MFLLMLIHRPDIESNLDSNTGDSTLRQLIQTDVRRPVVAAPPRSPCSAHCPTLLIDTNATRLRFDLLTASTERMCRYSHKPTHAAEPPPIDPCPNLPGGKSMNLITNLAKPDLTGRNIGRAREQHP